MDIEHAYGMIYDDGTGMVAMDAKNYKEEREPKKVYLVWNLNTDTLIAVFDSQKAALYSVEQTWFPIRMDMETIWNGWVFYGNDGYPFIHVDEREVKEETTILV